MRRNGNIAPGKKRLILVRHSDVEGQHPEITDFERSLTHTGKRNSRLMAEKLAEAGIDPGKIISSPAFRALETALTFSRTFDITAEAVSLATDLYLNLQQDEYINFIARQGDSNHTITLFGHNPLITDMAFFFAVADPGMLPKTGVLCLEFSAGSWSEVERGSGEAILFLSPGGR